MMAARAAASMALSRRLLCLRRVPEPPATLGLRASPGSLATSRFASSSSSSSSSSSRGGDGKDAPASAPFHGRYVIEGQVLPIAEADGVVAEREADEIESRLSRRTRAKASSSGLTSADAAAASAGMFVEASDRAAEHASKAYQVEGGNWDYLDGLPDVLKRLRKTNRDFDDRDVSDSLKHAMEYVRRRKRTEGR
eukprot:TRINITY_DN29644_c0_g1_i2.p2 TRINITY_DN29644_c0_g1~~TRINITY_DN29644_c0_g1_i2.p2  ORF type:complete len:195 (+),score=50.18 TRINITY_DN29644_c0_g1_i2:3-587(+)